MLNRFAQIFEEFLTEKSLHFNTRIDSDGDSVVEFPYKGKEAKMFFTGENGEYLSMFIVFARVPAERVSDLIFTCNEMNAKYKWVKFYLDKDADVVASIDAYIDDYTCGEECMKLVRRVVNITDEAYPTFARAMWA